MTCTYTCILYDIHTVYTIYINVKVSSSPECPKLI